jgi:hypothetical protein
MKQDVVSHDPASFSCHVFTYGLVCAHKKVSEIDDQNRMIGSRRTPGLQLTNAETCIGLGRMCNIIVCALVSDSMLCQHIFDVNSWHSCLLLLFHALLTYICLTLTDLSNFAPFQNVELSTNRDPIFGINSRRKHNTKFQHNLKS